MSLTVRINGNERTVEALEPGCDLGDLVAALSMKADRVAVELNGAICSRTEWPATHVNSGDRLEIVHFVGGGSRD